MVCTLFISTAKMEDLQQVFFIFISISQLVLIFGTGRVTLGALGDSFYEYLLKVWILTGKKEEKYPCYLG